MPQAYDARVVLLRLLDLDYTKPNEEISKVNASLVDMVAESVELTRKAGGELMSRQVVASIISSWRRINPEEAAVTG